VTAAAARVAAKAEARGVATVGAWVAGSAVGEKEAATVEAATEEARAGP